MAKAITKTKKVSISMMDKVVKEGRQADASFEWNGGTVEVKRTLSFTDMLAVIQTITASCFASDTGEYLPAARELATRSGLIERYSNIKLPDNIDHKYEILFGTDLYETVLQYVDRMQYGVILNSIDEKLDYMVEANIVMMRKQLGDIMARIEQMIDQTTAVFSGVNAADLEKVSKAIGEHGMVDEKKLMEAYLETKQGNSEE